MSAGHRHSLGHEHEYEPQRGLPERLPEGERLLWQGSPDWRALARRAFHVRKLCVYFAALVALRVIFVLADGGSAVDALRAGAGITLLASVAIGLMLLFAWLSARGAVYSITDRRVVMRIGIVLTVTFNLPYKRIASAGLHLDKSGVGDLPLALAGSDRIGWLHLWPHARPWRVARAEPMLRCVPDAQRVAQLLADAWSQATGLSTAPAPASAARQGDTRSAGAQPMLAAGGR